MEMVSRVALIAVAVLATVPGSVRAQEQWTPPAPEVLERAKAILDEVPLIDGHNDLPSKILGEAGGDMDRLDIAEPQPGLHTDLARLREGRVGAQFWAAYVTVDSMETGAALRHALREIDMVHRMADRYPELEFARTAADVERIFADGKIASMIGVEGGHAIENSLSALRMFRELGVLYMTLTHWKTLDWADAATDAPRHGGLSPFGEDVVREMNRLGMFVDLSHVSAETMRDALRVSEAPVLFSHSSAREVMDHPRNVPDDVLRMVRENGGVVMVNFCSCYAPPELIDWTEERDALRARLEDELGDDDEEAVQARLREWEERNPRPRGTVATMADHIDHIRDVAGIDYIGIGSDYDGVSAVPVGLDDVSTYPNLFAELLRRGYSEEDLKKIAGLNVLRAMREMEAVADRLAERESPSLAGVRSTGT